MTNKITIGAFILSLALGVVVLIAPVHASAFDFYGVTTLFMKINVITGIGFLVSSVISVCCFIYYTRKLDDLDELAQSLDEFAISSRVWNSNAYPKGFSTIAADNPEETWGKYKVAWATRPEMFTENGQEVMTSLQKMNT